MKALILTATLVASLLFTAQANARDLLSDVTRSISSVIGKTDNNPVATIYSGEIIRPIHVLTALRNLGATNVKLTTLINGIHYKVKYINKDGELSRLTFLNEGRKH